ncbi:unnamed protein product [Caenorhabditis bovis]|uniref:Kinase n=1 Tax=Caenorhabditis bovis TaxID=2654633 RepID=A0A8S1EVG8_9PELO|nr:unnamed protein product [Caenorhabditis bovis]
MVLNIKRASSFEGVTNHFEDILKPFDHQVGGHTPFTSFNNGHLLKPCDERELIFYQVMPSCLKKISPKCCTTIQGPIVSNTHDCCPQCKTQQFENVVIPESIEGSPILNKRKLSKNFIVISDLTYGMKCPRILDLKLGTRQHGDHASTAKVACMTAKCQSTTSANLGIRLCGMKLISPGKHVLIDKYEGRSMSEQRLAEEIRSFFDVSPEIVEAARRKMKRIREVLCESDGVRLFGASLLIVIEGDPHVEGVPPENLVRIRVVDFANATFPGFLGDNLYEGIDDGSILGLDTIERFLM